MAPTGVVSVKSPEAFRTISEVAAMLDVPQHVLRFWETRFSQIRPIKRAGGRRFYRPEDVDLLRGIQMLLYLEGYTIRGAQKILREKGVRYAAALGREQVKNGHAVDAAAEEIAAVEDNRGFDAPADVGDDAPETHIASDQPVVTAAPMPGATEPAPDPRRAQFEAMRTELQELKSRLAAARRRATA